MANRVVVGFCYGQSTQTPQWSKSYRHVLARDLARSRHIVGELAEEVSGVHIPHGRCRIVEAFLASKGDWLWLMDTDATFADDILDRLLKSADPVERPIVGALAFGVQIVQDDKGQELFNEVGAAPVRLFPTIYTIAQHGMNRIENYPKDQLVQCHSTGAHCVLIHRRVLEDPRWRADGHPLPWFRTSVWQGHEVSEDQFFYIKAGSFGYPVYVDTSIKTGHVKTFVADESMFLAQ